MTQPKTKMTLPSEADISGRSFGEEELAYLKKVIASGTLNCTKGTVVREFETKFAASLGMPFCRTTTSGTAAVHSAVAAVDPEPGDEIITSPITDMGAITPILYQTAIPVFADVDPLTYNVTAETIERKITRRTRAVIITHLFGNACDMDPIIDLCRRKGIRLIEDCAQAFGAIYKGKPVGTLGDIGCFSLQQTKHMTAGEGGMVVARDEALSRRMRLFIDKAWGYGDPKPDHYFLAMNYRMTELTGAVALAQFEKLPAMVKARVAMAESLTRQIEGVKGVRPPQKTPGCSPVYWRYALRVDADAFKGRADALGAKLKEAGIFCAPRYVQKLAFECEVLRDQRTFGKSRFPYVGEQRKGEPEIVYRKEDTPGAIEALAGVVVLPWNEKYTEEHVAFIAGAIRQAAKELS
ncbi:MAG TPA: DegT/DnrJ/EryC1/StrS family aminotransferase [Planctomycetota bacterium]|nr:DegT/DnrJ/EryC1/StrS family aminotransferase [Planctomycetota bacterium]